MECSALNVHFNITCGLLVNVLKEVLIGAIIGQEVTKDTKIHPVETLDMYRKYCIMETII